MPNQTTRHQTAAAWYISKREENIEQWETDRDTEMSSGFVTEAEVEERRKVRQEEWERVRKPNDPEAAPEEPVDNR